MSDYLVRVFFSEEDEGYIADIPALKYCSTFGTTPERALAELMIARAAWLESARALGKPVPAPVTDPNASDGP